MTRVLVDLTCLSTETRVRGIGRYAATTALSVARAARGRSDVEMFFLEHIPWLGTARWTTDAAAAIERIAQRHTPPRPRWSWSYASRLGLARAAGEARADILHMPHAAATPLWPLPSLKLVSCMDLIPLHFPERYLDWRDGWGTGRRLLDRRRYLTADHVTCISRTTADDLIELVGVPSERVSVEYCGVDLAAWPAEPEPGDAAVCREHGAQPGRFVLCVGDADWRKNADGTTAACGIAQRDLPELRLLWAGKLSGDRKQALRALAQQHGVALELLGFVPDEQLQALYRSALCTVFASRAEGFGYPVLEGMAIGCPVVTSNVSSMPEVAGNGALCVDPEAPAAIAEAIVRLARDGELRANLRERGFARARELTLDKQAEAMLALYTQLGRAAN